MATTNLIGRYLNDPELPTEGILSTESLLAFEQADKDIDHAISLEDSEIVVLEDIDQAMLSLEALLDKGDVDSTTYTTTMENITTEPCIPTFSLEALDYDPTECAQITLESFKDKVTTIWTTVSKVMHGVTKAMSKFVMQLFKGLDAIAEKIKEQQRRVGRKSGIANKNINVSFADKVEYRRGMGVRDILKGTEAIVEDNKAILNGYLPALIDAIKNQSSNTDAAVDNDTTQQEITSLIEKHFSKDNNGFVLPGGYSRVATDKTAQKKHGVTIPMPKYDRSAFKNAKNLEATAPQIRDVEKILSNLDDVIANIKNNQKKMEELVEVRKDWIDRMDDWVRGRMPVNDDSDSKLQAAGKGTKKTIAEIRQRIDTMRVWLSIDKPVRKAIKIHIRLVGYLIDYNEVAIDNMDDK